MFGILQWHFWYAPQWLAMLTWNMERMAVRYFSAGLMLRTLVSHWHKDAVSYQQGTIGKIFLAFAWNGISRAIGFVVRASVLAVYACVALAIAVVGIAAVITFLAWPAVALVGIIGPAWLYVIS